MADIAGEMESLQADVDALRARMIIERDVADYWYERCLKAEALLNDEVNYKPESRKGAGYPSTD